jgi:hypothetical protein
LLIKPISTSDSILALASAHRGESTAEFSAKGAPLITLVDSSQDNAIKKQAAVQAKRKAATRKFGQRLASRIKRVAVKSVAAIPAKPIPFIGVTLGLTR